MYWHTGLGVFVVDTMLIPTAKSEMTIQGRWDFPGKIKPCPMLWWLMLSALVGIASVPVGLGLLRARFLLAPGARARCADTKAPQVASVIL